MNELGEGFEMTITRKETWSVPIIDGLAGPDQLSDVFLDWLAWDSSSPNMPHYSTCLSEGNIRKLISLCYFTSQAQEEGRFPCFRVYSPLVGVGPNLRQIASFEPSILIDGVEVLRRLAPAVSSLDYALLIVEQDGLLKCNGVVEVVEDEGGISIGRPEVITGVPNGLLIRIDRPGEIRISQGLPTFLLRHGKISDIVQYYYIDGVRNWITECSKNIHKSIFSELDPKYKGYFGGELGIGGIMLQVVSTILAEASEYHSGGAFVVLPNAENEFIGCKYNVKECNISNAIKHLWHVCIDATKDTDISDFRNHVSIWDSSRRKLFSEAKAIANFSKVDGCVVIDRTFNVIGFGGKIQVDEAAIERSGLQYVCYHTKQVEKGDDINNFGTRHKSAFRLCKAIPGALAFVVSQDGDLRIFYSDSQYVYFLDALHAWSKHLPAW